MADIFRKDNHLPLTPAQKKQDIASLPDPTGGVEVDANGNLEDHPLDAIKALEGAGVSTEDGSIMNLLTPEETEALRLMIKHGEFNQRESAFLKYLMLTAGKQLAVNLEDAAVLYNELSPERRGKMEPPSKQFMKGKIAAILGRLFQVKGPKYGFKLKPGKSGKDIIKFMDLNKKIQAAVKKVQQKQASAAKKAQSQAMKEFWEEWKDLNRVRKAHGLPYKGAKELQADIDNFPNPNGTRGLKSNGEKVKLPLQSVNYKGGSDAIDRLEGRHNDK